MGLTFQNIQIHTQGKTEVAQVLHSGESAHLLSEEWVTVLLPGEDFSTGKKRATDISKQVSDAVLYVQYFDDDVLEIFLLCEGKILGRYINREGKKSFIKPSAWEKTIPLTKEEMSALRLIVSQEATPSFDLDRFSLVIGAPLLMDNHMFEYSKKNAVMYEKNPQKVKKILAEEKEKQTIKNNTKAVLNFEIAALDCSAITDTDIIRLILPDENGKYDFRTIHCYRMRRDMLVPYYVYQYPADFCNQDYKKIDYYWNPPTYEKISILRFYNEACTSNIDGIDGNAFEKALYEDKVYELSTKPMLGGTREHAVNGLPRKDKHGNLCLLEGRSTILVKDSNNVTLSQHRLKGTVFRSFIADNGNVCLISCDEYVYDSVQPSPPHKIRLYEIASL